jgi:hypothetical protein
MGATSAAISQLGLDLDLIEHKVLMRMRGGARRRMVVLAHGWPKPAMIWKRTLGKRSQGYGSYRGDGGSKRRKEKANGVNPDPSCSIYRGVH